MSSYLLNEGFKDASAVIAGSTLEEHLRILCSKNNIPIEYLNSKGILCPKKADTINADLYKAKIYSKLEHKQTTAWLELRNNAAHGKYSEYDTSQVKLMINGIRDFIIKYNT